MDERELGGGLSTRRWRRVARAAVAVVVTVAVAAAVVGCSGGDDAGSGDAGSGDAGSGAGGAPDREGGAARGRPVPSDGCDGPATEQADLVEATMPVRGAERRYLVSAPAWEEGHEPPPLVLDFHGLSEGADIHAEMTQLGPLGVEEGFVTVFPHGTGAPVSWDVTADVEANDDLAFVAALLDRVEEERCVDTSRVYATGLSNGAMMTSVVACTMGDRIAAVAPVAGVLLPDGCEPPRPVPMLTYHGTADPILLFNGGVDASVLSGALGGGEPGATTTTVDVDLDGEGYPETVRRWAELNGCAGEPEDERVSEEVIRRTYDCPDDAAVEFVIVEGGGHSWPSSEFSRSIERVVGHTTFDVDASRDTWAFLTRFRLPAAEGG